MNSREAIKLSIDMGKMVAMMYLSDLTDEDLMRRPYSECNHINWQLGHLIYGENYMNEALLPGSMPPLPAGFAEKYTKETAKSDDPAKFCRKEELLQLFEQQRAATLAALDKLSDADLDKPSLESMQAYAPTLGAVFSLHGSHCLMHAGQWAVVRRQLGKPPLF